MKFSDSRTVLMSSDQLIDEARQSVTFIERQFFAKRNYRTGLKHFFVNNLVFDSVSGFNFLTYSVELAASLFESISAG